MGQRDCHGGVRSIPSGVGIRSEYWASYTAPGSELQKIQTPPLDLEKLDLLKLT